MAKSKAELGDKQRERLKTLGKQWEEENYSAWFSSLSAGDLRLLLEHFRPLRDLIRAIAQGKDAEEKAAPPPMPEAEANLAAALAAAQAEAETLRREVARLAQAVADALAERDAARHALAERDKELARLKRALEDAQRERAALARQIDELRRTPPLGKAGEVLAFLCSRDDLQKRLGLEGLRPDAEGMVRMVAVLAQKDNAVRLLETLGEAAQKRKAPVSPEELALLEAAVAWLNYNWKSRPYRLVLPEHGRKYEYEAHRRASYTPVGETIVSVLAPGLQNGAGGWELKPIVATE